MRTVHLFEFGCDQNIMNVPRRVECAGKMYKVNLKCNGENFHFYLNLKDTSFYTEMLLLKSEENR